MKKDKKSSQSEPETKEIFKPKRKIGKYVWLVLVLALAGIAGYFLFVHKSKPIYKVAYIVAKQDVRQSVIATGTVTSKSNLNLSFKVNGIVSKINVKVGDKVKVGQLLASLDARDAQAQVAVAKAAVSSAKVSLNNAKNNYQVALKQQQSLVDNAYATMLSSSLAAVSDSSLNTVTLSVSGTYIGKEQGSYTITPVAGGDGYYFNYSGLESGYSKVVANVPMALGTKGLFLTFSSSNLSSSGNWSIKIPNLQSASYITNSNAYQAALQTQNQQINSAQAAIDSAQAALATAQAQLLVAQYNYENDLLTVPLNGQITSVDMELGEQVAAFKEVIVLQDPSALHVETEIPESSISQIKLGQSIDMTFDAFGPDKRLVGTVTSIDPASTVVAGVIDFRVISSLPADPAIKPGMTVNMNIIITDMPDVLAVPNRIIDTANGKKTVLVQTATGALTVKVSTGLVGDNFTQILSGLSEGDVLVSAVK